VQGVPPRPAAAALPAPARDAAQPGLRAVVRVVARDVAQPASRAVVGRPAVAPDVEAAGPHAPPGAEAQLWQAGGEVAQRGSSDAAAGLIALAPEAV
jgi:hypothetical protein